MPLSPFDHHRAAALRRRFLRQQQRALDELVRLGDIERALQLLRAQIRAEADRAPIPFAEPAPLRRAA
jgi:hypothetical protein